MKSVKRSPTGPSAAADPHRERGGAPGEKQATNREQDLSA